MTGTFLSAKEWLGGPAVFGMYLGCTLAGLLFSWLAIPDTADKNPIEIEESMSKMRWWRRRRSDVSSSPSFAYARSNSEDVQTFRVNNAMMD